MSNICEPNPCFFKIQYEERKMKYGKRLRSEVARNFPEWERQFMSYKELKQQLKLIHLRSRSTERARQRRGGHGRERFSGASHRRNSAGGFARLLDGELDKVIGFYYDKEEDCIIRLKELQLREVNLNGCNAKLQLQRDVLSFHNEMVLLLHYSVLNFTGLIKIVKKHNKQTRSGFQFSSMPRVMQQPNFSTEMLYKLMKECEDMLGRLFLP